MKKFLLIPALAVSLLSKAQLSGSLTACYALNGNAAEPINSLTGTLSAAVTPTADRNNLAGAALQFNGTSTCTVTLPEDPRIKSTDMTFSAWIKPVFNSGSASQYIVFTKNIASSNFEAYALALNSSGSFIATKGDNGAVASAFGTVTINSNTWHHVAFTFNASEIRLYVDGNLDLTVSSTITAGYQTGKKVILGGSAESAFDLPYNGAMDNVRFYNRVLSASEISQLYTQDPACVTLPVNLTSSLTACYALNGTAGEPVNGLTGTVSAVTASSDRNNTAASAMNFSGSSTSSIALPASNLIKSQELSLSAWVKPASNNAAQYVVFTKNTASSNFEAYALVFNANGTFTAIKGNNGNLISVNSTGTVSTGTWHHLVFTLSNTELNLYLNGNLQASNTNSLAIGYENGKPVVLGGSGEGFNLPFSGDLDNVRFYNRVINASEVSQLYSQDPQCTTTNTNTNTTGLLQNSDAVELLAFPNPASDKLTIQTSLPATILIRDVVGRVVLTSQPEAQEHVFDLSGEAAGVYFAECKSGNTVTVRRILKQ